MRILMALIMILGAGFALFIALVSVFRDLLVITGRAHSELNSHPTGHEESGICANVSEDVQ